MAKTFLLTGEFPPMQTGIARMMGELTRRYPRGELLVSTGQHRDSQDSDVHFSGAVVDRLPVPSKALRNLADQVARSGARTASADQLARDAGRLQQQAAASQGSGVQPQTPAAKSQGQAGAGDTGQQSGPGVGDGTNPDVLGDQPSRLATAGQRVEVPTKLGAGSGVRPPDGSEDQTGTDPRAPAGSVSELVQSQQTGQVAPEQNLVPGEQRPVVRGYFR